MLSRPIVLAPLLGWALGDPRGGLVLGVPLELIFLGGVNLGGSLPDNETLRAAAGDDRAARSNLRGLLLPFAVTASICFACAAFSPLLGIARSGCPPRLAFGLTGAWHAVWALAAASAIRAIRDPRAPALAAIGFGATLAAAAVLRALP